MALYQIKNLAFKYPEALRNALEDINLTIHKGEFVIFCGPSGSGKTTLLRQLKKQVQPHGLLKGEVIYNGISLEALNERQSAEEIAMIFQDPDNQIVMHTVEQELSFAMENLGYSSETMQRRIGEIVNFFGIEGMLTQPVHKLSGGQKQILNLASVLVLRPKVLLLDEPTSQLDPIASKEFLEVLYRINQEMSISVIMSEHRLEDLFPMATKVVFMDGGQVRYNGSPNETIYKIWQDQHPIFASFIPAVSQLYLKMTPQTKENEIPITVKAARNWFDAYYLENRGRFNLSESPCEAAMNNRPIENVICCKDLFFQYEKSTPQILRRLSFEVKRGEFYVILGGNGAGKSTFLKLLAGIENPQKGKIHFADQRLDKIKKEERVKKIGYVAQNPLTYFTKDTVKAQLEDRLRAIGSEKLEEMIRLFQLEDVLEKHPYDISGGQQQKLVLAMVMLGDPQVILLDEPTKGLDPVSKRRFAGLLQAFIERGKTLVMVSHDVEFAAKYASKCGLLFNGEVTGVTTPKEFFKDNYFYTTTVHRVVGENLNGVIGIDEVIGLWDA